MGAARQAYDRFASDAEALKADVEGEGRKSLIYRLMLYKMPDTGRPLRQDEVLSESEAHLIGGSETTATTASLILWALTQHPEVMEKLREELDANMPEHGVLEWNKLVQLPYFNAVLKEGMRLYSIIPGPLPRVIPPTMTNLTIAGVKIPTGTCVATQAWTVHRQADIFPEPYAFKPERWMDGNETERMRTNYIPFGVGPRICVGQNLGMTMLRMIISSVVRNFEVKPAPETNAHSMRLWESFALFPAGLQVKMNLVPRQA